MKTDWNETRDGLLKAYHKEGWSFSNIATKINKETGSSFSRNACIGRARRINLEMRAARSRVDKSKCLSTRPHSRGPYKPRLATSGGKLEPPEFLCFGLDDLKASTCRYPHGEQTPYTFCGQPTQDDSSYCAYHHALCHVKTPPKPLSAPRVSSGGILSRYAGNGGWRVA